MSEQLESFISGKLASGVDRRDFLKIGLGAVGSAALAACGGPTAGPTGPTGPEFKLGLVLPYSLVYADLGNSITNGFQLYLDKVGAQAGNRRITVLKEDEKVSTADAVAATKKLVEQSNVDMIAGYVASPNAAGNRDYLTQNQVPTLVANAGANALSRAARSPYIYRTSFSNWQPTHPMGTYLSDNLGVKTVQLVYANYAAGNETAQSFRETFKGTFPAADVKPDLGYTGDWAQWVNKVSNAVDAIYVFLSGTDSQGFLKKATELGSFRNLRYITGSGFFVEQDVLQAIGEAAPVGAISGLHWALTLDNKENKDFVSAYTKKYNKQPDVFAVQGYDTARVLVEALNAVKGKTDDKQAFLKAISQVSFKSPRGDFKFDPATNNVVNTIYVRKLQKDSSGKYVNAVIATYPNVADPGK